MHYLPFWKQVFDGMQLVKELSGHPIREQLIRRPDMICQARCHRWGHGSPQTQRSSSTGRRRRWEPCSHAFVGEHELGIRQRPPPWFLAPCQVLGDPVRAPCSAPLALTLWQVAPCDNTGVDGPADRGVGHTCRYRFWGPAADPCASVPHAPALAPVDDLCVP